MSQPIDPTDASVLVAACKGPLLMDRFSPNGDPWITPRPMEKMTDAEFLDEYVEQMIAILEDALKHDGAAPPVAEDARELNIRKAIIANIENVERWKQIRLGSDPEQFKGLTCSVDE